MAAAPEPPAAPGAEEPRQAPALYDVGDMPYRLARPFLLQCKPEQLRMLEDASPHLLEDTDELWHRACLRDFSDLRKLGEEGRLEAPPSWRDLYQTKQQQAEEAKALATARIKGRYAEHSAQKNAKKLIVTDVPIPTQQRRPRPVDRTPPTPLQLQGRAMLLKARTGLGMRARQMMRPPRTYSPARPGPTSSALRPPKPASSRHRRPPASGEFYSNAIHTLTTALNRGQKPKAIVGDIAVQELHMGTVPPELEILEIGDLSKDRFRGIFRFVYAGDAHLELSTGVQANPLARSSESLGLLAGPAASRGMLFAASPLTVPMRVRLSDVKLRAIVVLVVSRSKGVTLVFKNDPLESVRVSSTFDSVGVIQKYLQEEIEGQLREMFREDLPGIIHRLSQDWLRTETTERPSTAPTPQPAQDPPPDRPWTPPLATQTWSADDSAETPLSVLALEHGAPHSGAPGLTRLASSHSSSRGLKDLVEPHTQSPTRAPVYVRPCLS
ncbi:ERMES complex subunit [Malassezia nana]|uniref:ERMES complex subunit n=1 Tax=Malassezia nana TaxID=180528 RepID=A0AAF0EPB7_9BASI|nr:ERMES complex subunit [Malassezia nana]